MPKTLRYTKVFKFIPLCYLKFSIWIFSFHNFFIFSFLYLFTYFLSYPLVNFLQKHENGFLRIKLANESHESDKKTTTIKTNKKHLYKKHAHIYWHCTNAHTWQQALQIACKINTKNTNHQKTPKQKQQLLKNQLKYPAVVVRPWVVSNQAFSCLQTYISACKLLKRTCIHMLIV